jgi:hypothetical protein
MSTWMRRPLLLQVALFVALLSTALALGAAMAHVLELPNKIALPRDQYCLLAELSG